jgi:C6 transcription factor Pro1
MSSHQSGLVRHYLDHVLQRQYLLADTSIADFIVRTVQQNPAVRDAVCLLASLHQESLRQGNASTGSQSNANDNAVVVHNNEPYADSSKTYKRICDSLRTSAAGGYTEGEAMAGLFVVSAFLFRGGRGAWQQFLAVAAEWVWNVLNSSADPAEAIRRCSDSQQFVIKTTFWFDILASTTRLEPPRFIGIYRKLWAPRSAGAYIETAAAGGTSSCYAACCGSGCCSGGVCDAESGGPCGCSGSGSQAQSTLCMMSVMGCGNVTALAIAETSALACWKEAHLRQGTLSIPELVDRGRAIEAECLSRVPVHQHSQVHAHPQQQQQQQQQQQHPHHHQQHPHPHHSHSHHPHPYPAGGSEAASNANADLAAKRRLTAEIFRATARVYLHSVISGEHPACPEIRDAVRETIECLQRVPAGSAGTGGSSSSVARSVLRSVVFGICLCGCLADDPADREFLLRRLDAEERTEGVGNCASARAVMQQVWNSRAQAATAVAVAAGGGTAQGGGSGGGGRETPLSWREATQQYVGESLLLV